MKTGPVNGGRRDNGEAAQQFVADTDSGQNIVAGTAAALGGGEGDETVVLGQGGFLQYVYRFQSGGIF